MTAAQHVTAVETERARWGVRRVVLWAGAAVILLAVIVLIAVFVLGLRLIGQSTPHYADPVAHFKYGSIGAEPASGLPYKLWMALPYLFPEEFAGRTDWAAFGFLYEDDAPYGLPIGIARREVMGVDVAWFNCAVCHAGTYRIEADGPRAIVAGMPANNLDLGRLIEFLLSVADDDRLSPANVFAAIERSGQSLSAAERLLWQYTVLPRVREGLLLRRVRLEPLMEAQPAWGPGRVDTFNPYKVVSLVPPMLDLSDGERVGASDFPPIFLQADRRDMQLHWDGNNPSLDERNLSAALGAGVTPETIDHAAIGRVADWLLDLEPPPSPIKTDDAAAAAGRTLFMAECASCHGHLADDGRYVFAGDALGAVTPIEAIGTDRSRLDSYTEAFRQRQLGELFAGTPYRFRHFVKTDGYANMPLDGLWLRAPYLHNGSVPTLAALLLPPEERPAAYLRGSDVLDMQNGGFAAPACAPGAPAPDELFCFDTSLTGNGNGGHVYGTALDDQDRAALLAYLLRF